MAVNAAGTMLAAHGSQFRNFDYDERVYILILRAENGHFVTDLTKIKHGDSGKAEFTVFSGGMYFDPYGMVYMAHSNIAKTLQNADNGAFNNYASKLVISAYNVNTS